jgi:hypothetical protein
MVSHDEFVDAAILSGLSSTERFGDYWASRFEEVLSCSTDTWDYVWTYSCWANSGLTCTPRVNLISNIGFGPEGTHTTNPNSACANMATGAMTFPLEHPRVVAAHQRFDAYVERTHFKIGRRRRGQRRLPERSLQYLTRLLTQRA